MRPWLRACWLPVQPLLCLFVNCEPDTGHQPVVLPKAAAMKLVSAILHCCMDQHQCWQVDAPAPVAACARSTGTLPCYLPLPATQQRARPCTPHRCRLWGAPPKPCAVWSTLGKAPVVLKAGLAAHTVRANCLCALGGAYWAIRLEGHLRLLCDRAGARGTE